jgi:hypothetical protein
MEGTPLQRHRRALGMTQEQVADQLRNEVGPAHGDADQARELAAEAHAVGVERSSAKVLGRVRLAA